MTTRASTSPERATTRIASAYSAPPAEVLRGRFGGECPGQFRRGLPGEWRDREPTRLGRVGALHRETARVRDDAHPVPRGGGLVREDRGDVEHLLQRVRADHTVLPEQRVQSRVRCDDGSGMRGRRSDTGGTPPALDGDDRFPGADPPRQTRETFRVPEGLEVEQDHVGSLVVGPVTQDVVPGDVGLVADGNEMGEPDAESRRLVHHGEPDGAALREESHPPFHRDRRREGAVQPDVGIRVHDAHTVRTDQTHPRSATHFDELALALRSFSSDLREAGGDHDEGAHPFLGALACHGDHVSGRHRDEREVDRGRKVPDARERGHPLYRCGARVDRVDDAMEPPFEEVQEEPPSDRAWVARGSDHRDHIGRQERPDRVRGGLDVPILEVTSRVLRKRGRDRDLDRAGERADPW